jgi:hypothetical protein
MSPQHGASTTDTEGNSRGHSACQAIPQPLDSSSAHTGVEGSLSRPHGLQGCHPRSTARTSPPSKVNTLCGVSTVHAHDHRSHAPPSARSATAPSMSHRHASIVVRAQNHCCCLASRGGGERGATEATQPPRLPTRPPKLHPSCRLHQSAATEHDRLTNNQPNGLPGSPHTLHPPRRFAIQLPPSAIVVSTSHCNQRGRWRKGEQPRPNGGLRGCQATSATPCATAGLSTHRRPPPPNPAAVPPNPAALHHLSVGSNLLAMPGATSPPRVASPLMGTSPNRIYRLAAQPAPSDLLPAAQHKKNSPPGRRCKHRAVRGEPCCHLPCSPLGSAEGAAPMAAWQRGRKRQQRREGVGVASQMTRGLYESLINV